MGMKSEFKDILVKLHFLSLHMMMHFVAHTPMIRFVEFIEESILLKSYM